MGHINALGASVDAAGKLAAGALEMLSSNNSERAA
jgi:hypothetical protein